MRALAAAALVSLAGACQQTAPATAGRSPGAYGGDMVQVPPGEVVVGDLGGSGRDDERPARRLRVARAFAVGRYEVTNGDYEQFVRATGHRPPPHWRDGVCDKELARHAVTHVSWEDAQAYCAWAGVRLLTEVEWEYVARGGTRWTWPWGDRMLPQLANVRHDPSVRQEPVGSHPKGASVFGVEDLAGGVWEWVADAYVEDRWARLNDGDAAEACAEGEGRVLKGGAWSLPPELARIAARDRTSASAKGLMIGFRVARDM